MIEAYPKRTPHPKGRTSPCCDADLFAPANALIKGGKHVQRRWRCAKCGRTYRVAAA